MEHSANQTLIHFNKYIYYLNDNNDNIYIFKLRLSLFYIIVFERRG